MSPAPSQFRPGRWTVVAIVIAVGWLDVAAAAPPPAPPSDPRTFFVLINGGGRRDENFQSHVVHLRELTAELLAAGVPKDRITLFASDGENPAPDHAVRDEPPAEAWRLEGTEVEEALSEPLRFANTVLPGFQLLPATRAALTRWLRAARRQLRAGDTLILYVTDHGTDHPRDPTRNQISLWKGEGLDVRQLATALRPLPAGVRIVSVMSQCFSGGFAHLGRLVGKSSGRERDVCGFFSSPADRPAYGCFPESAVGNRSGHAFAFIDAIRDRRGAQAARLTDLHGDLLLSDRSPDVPLASSDVFLSGVLARSAAKTRKADPDAVADGHLVGLPPGTPGLAQAAAIARNFGLPAERSLVVLASSLREIESQRARLGRHQGIWDEALLAANRVLYGFFLDAHPDWRPRLRPRALRRLTASERRARADEVTRALAAFAPHHARLADQVTKLRDRSDATAELLYRLDVRLAAGMRIRSLLTSAAARARLLTEGSRADRRQLAALEVCEATPLPVAHAGAPIAAEPTGPLPPRTRDEPDARALHPRFLGVVFRAPTGRARAGLPLGAAAISDVVPASPAAAAGVAVGDVVVATDGAPLDRDQELGVRVLLAETERLSLEIVRDKQRLLREVVLGRLPDPPAAD